METTAALLSLQNHLGPFHWSEITDEIEITEAIEIDGQEMRQIKPTAYWMFKVAGPHGGTYLIWRGGRADDRVQVEEMF